MKKSSSIDNWRGSKCASVVSFLHSVSRRMGFSRHSSKSPKKAFNNALNSLRGLDCSRFFYKIYHVTTFGILFCGLWCNLAVHLLFYLFGNNIQWLYSICKQYFSPPQIVFLYTFFVSSNAFVREAFQINTWL